MQRNQALRTDEVLYSFSGALRASVLPCCIHSIRRHHSSAAQSYAEATCIFYLPARSFLTRLFCSWFNR
jgi:hypothetical protein